MPSCSVRCPLKYVEDWGEDCGAFEDFDLCVPPRVPVAKAWLLWKNLHSEMHGKAGSLH